MKNIKDYDLKELKEELANIGEKPFRAEQIFKWLYQEKVKSFDEMTNLSLELREKLKQNYTICNFKILRKQEAKDGTIKYLFDVLDENAIETVLMSYHHGYSICVSSQIGCKMGCKFCASTGINFVRSLTSGEIVEQILAVEQDTGVRISNVVFMGIGEPLDNYDNVINAIHIINNPKGLNIGARHISVSTSGLVPKIYELAKENIPCTLSISLHATNNEKRSSMMPVNNAYPIEELIQACKDYIESTNRRISFEYALAKDNNDNLEDAKQLVKLLKGMLCHVNLIPINKIENGASISEKQREWNARRDEIIERYDKLAEEFGIKNEDYFLTSVKRYNFLEPGTTKHKKINAVLGYNPGLYLGNETIIDGFFLIKEDKFVFMEIDNRDFKKVNAGINNFYFDKIVSMRVTKSLGDESKYEDITKRAWTSPHDIKRSIQNDIQSLKAIRFKDLIINNDSADMFDRLLIKLVDNTSYEIRLPSYEFGQKLVDLFESLKGQPQKVIIENQNSQPNKAQLLSEYQELLNSGAITQEEYDKLKQEILFN